MARRFFIKGATKHKGRLKRRAKAAGMTVSEFCRIPHKQTIIKRECNLFHTLRRLAKRRKR